MTSHETFNNENKHVNMHSYLSNDSLRDAFLDWLSVEDSKEYAPNVLANYLDGISEYVLRKKIYVVDLWRIFQHHEFQKIYNKLKKDIGFRIKKRATYKIFLTVGAFL